jgi:large subunit ribosomal protein L21
VCNKKDHVQKNRLENRRFSAGQTAAPAAIYIDFWLSFDYYKCFKNPEIRDEERVMYAIIASGGKQFTVTEGSRVRIEKVAKDVGEEIALQDVLAINDDEKTLVGAPYLAGASVLGKVVAQGKARKVTVFKYKRRKDSKKKKGHRQSYTEVLIEKIQLEASHGA